MEHLPVCFLKNCKSLTHVNRGKVGKTDKTLLWLTQDGMASEGLSEQKQRDWNKWLTASVGIATAIAGVIQFYYKEIFAPAKVPVNIALDLEIKPLDADPLLEKDIITALMHIRISNKGTKSVYLKSPTWTAFGMHRTWTTRDAGSFSIPNIPDALDAWCPKKTGQKSLSEADFVTCLNRSLAPLDQGGNSQEFTDRIELPLSTTQTANPREVIASGPVGKDRELKPGQEILSQVLIPVSKQPKYDYLEALISVPTVSGVSSDEADKIASAVFINLQPEEPAKGLQSDKKSRSKTYQKLRGFCLTKAKPASLVNSLNAFRLPRRTDGDSRSHPGEKTEGICYNSSTIPDGNFMERNSQFVRHVLKADELNRFGAQFYDSTFEVPLQLPKDSASSQQSTTP
jgi:hypothetical protein